MPKKINQRTLIIFVVFILVLYVIVPELKSFSSTLTFLKKPNIAYLLIATIFTTLTFAQAALSYVLLAFKKIKFLEELLIQSSSMFINSLLPAGIGGLGANYAYLRHAKHSKAQATSTVAVNNILGLVGHLLLLLLTISLFEPNTFIPHSLGVKFHSILTITLIVIIILTILSIIFGKTRIKKFISNVKTEILSYRSRFSSVIFTLLIQMSLTLANTLTLYFCARSVSIELPLAASLVIFTLGNSIKNVTPTPGGIGGVEAGIVAGYVAYGVPAGQALAAVLFFRFVNFWLPLGIGFVSFIFAEKLKLYNLTTSESH